MHFPLACLVLMLMKRHENGGNSEMSHHPQHSSEDETRHAHQRQRDWRVWLVVGLMLGAMAMYVLTLDDSVIPGLIGR